MKLKNYGSTSTILATRLKLLFSVCGGTKETQLQSTHSGTRAVGVGQNDLKAWSGETRIRGGSTSKGRKGGLLRDATKLEQLNRMLVLYSYMCPNSIEIVEGNFGIEGQNGSKAFRILVDSLRDSNK